MTVPMIPNYLAIDISCVFSIPGNAASPGVRRESSLRKWRRISGI